MKPIRMVILDVDGVMTDGRIIYDTNGIEYKAFDSHDGYGITRAIQKGLMFAIISGRGSKAVEYRAKHLGITDVILHSNNKVDSYKTLKAKYNISDTEVCFIGDDEFDIQLLNLIGFSAAPANAIQTVKKNVQYVCKQSGGGGAVREVLDMILKAKKLL